MKIEITISSAVAGDMVMQFAVKQPVHAVKKRALAALGLDPAMSENYVLVHDGSALSEQETLDSLGISEGDVLVLEPTQPEVI